MAFAFNGDKSKADLLELVYPIGAIYMSVNDTNPSALFGGTWEAWGSGRVPVGVDSTDDNFSTVERTGGAATHALTTAQLPAHTHTYAKPNTSTGSTSLTIAQIPAHTHAIPYAGDTAASLGGSNPEGKGNVVRRQTTGSATFNTDSTGGGGGHTHTVGTSNTASGSTGSGNAHNNLQPYITCYMWKRTA